MDVDTEWKMMQEIEGRSAKEASRIMSDTPEICGFNRNVEEFASEVDDAPGEMAVNGGWAWDDVKNQVLDLKKVLEARRHRVHGQTRSLEGGRCEGVLGENEQGTDHD